MYGLPSRESLSKRQSRWLRALDEDVRSNPAQNAFNRETPTDPVKDKPRIISIMADIDDQIPQIIDSGISLSSGKNNSITTGIPLTSYQKPSTKHINKKAEGSSLKPFNNHLMGIIPEDPSDDLSVMQNFYEELQQTRKKYTKLEQDYELLKQNLLACKLSDQSTNQSLDSRIQKLESISEQLSEQASSNESSLLNRISKLEQLTQPIFNLDDLLARVKKLETISDITALSNRVSFLEKSFSKLSEYSVKASNPGVINPNKINENLSDFGVINPDKINENLSDFSVPDPINCQKSGITLRTGSDLNSVQEFVPYIIKEDYAACDNFTKLTGLHFEMLVEILGFYSETPIIFPFGTETNLPRFAELTLEMSFKDANKAVDGTAYGILKRRTDGVYTIELTELYSDGNASGIEKYTLPLIFVCKTDLLLE